jgi:predicted acetyltransferase
MSNCFLVVPNKEFKKGFEDYVMSYKKVNDEYYYNKYKKALEVFGEYLNDLDKLQRGEELPPDCVPTSNFWLVAEEKVVGVVRVRHFEIDTAGHIGYDISPDYRNKGYGIKILQLALVKASELGIKEVIVTCNIENVASRKIIEKNNGKLLGTIFDEEENEFLYKYCINACTADS